MIATWPIKSSLLSNCWNILKTNFVEDTYLSSYETILSIYVCLSLTEKLFVFECIYITLKLAEEWSYESEDTKS